jgi:hypothetical protein
MLVARISALLTLLAATFAASVARAEERDAVAAEAVFREGRKAVEDGDYARACPKFEESYRLDPAQGTLLNLADCEEHVGKLASAWVHYRSLLERLPKDDDRRAHANEHWSALDHRLPRLTLTLDTGAPQNARVLRDGVELGPAARDVAMAVDPGPHAVKVRADGRAERSFDIELREGESRALVVAPGGPLALPTVASPATGPVVPSTESGSTRRIAAWVTLGVGAVSLGVGTYFGLHALSKESDSQALCTGDVCRDPSGLDAHTAAQSSALAADVFIGVGIAAVATAAVLIITSKPPPSARALGRRVVLGVSW